MGLHIQTRSPPNRRALRLNDNSIPPRAKCRSWPQGQKFLRKCAGHVGRGDGLGGDHDRPEDGWRQAVATKGAARRRARQARRQQSKTMRRAASNGRHKAQAAQARPRVQEQGEGQLGRHACKVHQAQRWARLSHGRSSNAAMNAKVSAMAGRGEEREGEGSRCQWLKPRLSQNGYGITIRIINIYIYIV